MIMVFAKKIFLYKYIFVVLRINLKIPHKKTYFLFILYMNLYKNMFFPLHIPSLRVY